MQTDTENIDEKLIAEATIVMDRKYYELHYDLWLKHRSRFKKYELWIGCVLTVSGLLFTYFVIKFFIVGLVLLIIGGIEIISALISKHRWVRACLKNAKKSHPSKLTFWDQTIQFESPNGISKLRQEGVSGLNVFDEGFFLILSPGSMIFVSKSSIQPPENYSMLIETLKRNIDTR